MTTTLEHRFHARGAALDAFHARDDEVLLAGPAGTGKSRAALEKLHMVCLLTPNVRALILRKTARSLATSALKTWERDVVPEAMRDGTVNFYGGSSREPAQYRYSNGSSVAIGGMDDPMKIMSTEYDIVYVQEATELTEEEWEMITTRLRNGRLSFQQLLADCNPSSPVHWLLDRANKGKLKHLVSRHEDNPRYFNADGSMTEEGIAYMKKLDALTGVRYLRLRRGIWAAAEGIIYEDYDPSIHIIDPFPVPAHWTRIWSVDFGHTNPFVWQDWALDEDGRGYLVREIYMSGRLVEDHARQIRSLIGLGPIDMDGNETKYEGPRRAAWERVEPIAIACDHDAEDRATFERHTGFGTVAAKKDVLPGIELVQGRMKMAADGRPRIFFFRNALIERDPLMVEKKLPTCTVEEVPGYQWHPEPPAADRKKEQPLKRNDHGCDAIRYSCSEMDMMGGVVVRFG